MGLLEKQREMGAGSSETKMSSNRTEHRSSLQRVQTPTEPVGSRISLFPVHTTNTTIFSSFSLHKVSSLSYQKPVLHRVKQKVHNNACGFMYKDQKCISRAKLLSLYFTVLHLALSRIHTIWLAILVVTNTIIQTQLSFHPNKCNGEYLLSYVCLNFYVILDQFISSFHIFRFYFLTFSSSFTIRNRGNMTKTL